MIDGRRDGWMEKKRKMERRIEGRKDERWKEGLREKSERKMLKKGSIN